MTQQHTTQRGADGGDDLATIAADAENLAVKLALRVRTATFNQDEATVRWLWKQLLSVERRYQDRVGSTETGSGAS